MITGKDNIDEALKVKHIFSHGVYAKQMTIAKGTVFGTHKHTFTHISIVGKGSASVEVDGMTRIYKAGECVEIEAGKEHKVTALEDLIWYCIHATAETDPAKIDGSLHP
jgi:quercetin dioxygenase-like cupin family protein